MKLLLISAEVPWPQDQGGRIATYQLYVRGLSELGHTIDGVFAVQAGQKLHEEALSGYIRRLTFVPHKAGRVRSICRAVGSVVTRVPYANLKFMPGHMADIVNDLVREYSYDLVIADRQEVVGAIATLRGTKTVIHFHNINSNLYARTGSPAGLTVKGLHSRLQARISRDFERAIGGMVDGGIVASQEDRDRLNEVGFSAPVWIAPFGIDTEHFKADVTPITWPWPDVTGVSHPVIVVTGSMDYYPNVDGVRFLIGQVMPAVWASHAEARVAIVGRNPTRVVRALANDRRVLVTGAVPDVRPYLRAATVAAVVLRTGGGMRLKALEAAACGKAIVGTTIGLEGIAIQDGVHGWVADEPSTLAGALAHAIENPERCRAMGLAAQRLVEEQYDWRVCAQRVEDILVDVVEQAERVSPTSGT